MSSNESLLNSAESAFQQISQKLNDSSKQSQTETYLADTPESFQKYLHLLKLERTYLSENYREFYEWIHRSSKKKLGLWPRGTYKSSIVRGYCHKGMTRNPNLRIMYAMDVYAKALKSLGWVKRQFETNIEHKRLFGNFVGKRGWKDEELWLRKRTDYSKSEPNFFCAGVDQSRTGLHCDWLIFDDIISKENVKTAAGMKKVAEFVGDCMSILDPPTPEVPEAGLMLWIGTRWDDSDEYGKIIRTLADMYDIVIKKATVTDETTGEVTYVFQKNGLTKEFLDAYKRVNGSYMYSCQYDNDPVSRENTLFKREQLRVVPRYEFPGLEYMNIYMLTDAASAEDTGDDRVCIIIGKDYRNWVWALDLAVGKWDPWSYCDVLVSKYIKWNCRKMGMEAGTLFNTFKAMLDKKSTEEHISIKYEPIQGRNTVTKPQRIQRLQGRFEGGTIIWNEEICVANPDLLRVEAGQVFGTVAEQFTRITMEGVSRGIGDDVPDALSDVDQENVHGKPLFPPASNKPRIVKADVGMVNGHYNSIPIVGGSTEVGGDFWSQLDQIGRENRGF